MAIIFLATWFPGLKQMDDISNPSRALIPFSVSYWYRSSLEIFYKSFKHFIQCLANEKIVYLLPGRKVPMRFH